MVLTINLENHEAIVGLTEGFGLRVVIHEQNSLPLPSDLGFTVSAGYETSVGLRMVNIKNKYSFKHNIRKMCVLAYSVEYKMVYFKNSNTTSCDC